ncbi:hypothetical protein ONZ43_g2774 [Nemania bipapillata]|uniref:Uncharacterized protein n=1 Tax=Nemania bipapillata TaxID=110536 RepID=A0ACC2IZD8_9PEZI|nr:hypothetical protein ONZ43_g2774 [Nemania bipapillata]
MQCYAELTPPTAVTHSISLPFISAQSNNLVVARASLLQIFTSKLVSAELDNAQNSQLQSSTVDQPYDARINDDDGLEASFLGTDSALVRSDRSHYTKLVLVAEFPLAGTVTGLARIKSQASASGGDALLLALKDAKLSMVEWDPVKHSIQTTSIHYYEQEDLQGSPWAAPLSNYVNFLTADPGSRCAAFKFGTRSLAIIQFKSLEEDVDMQDWDEELDGPRPVKEPSTTLANGTSNNQETPFSTSFVLRLPNLDPSLIHPVHIAFLYEYREPTFGILSSTCAPSSVLGRKDQLSYMVFTLDLEQKASTTILSVNGLPQDLFRVLALPAPVGGALLIGANELIHIDQSGKTHGVGVNSFSKQATSFSLIDQSELELKIEGCQIEIISAENGELLMVLNDGRLALITFRIDGRTVSGLSVQLVGPDSGGNIVPTRASTLSKLGRTSLFVGSEDSDSHVVGWTRKQSQSNKRKNRVHDASLDLDMDDEDLEDFEDDDDLYGEESAPPKQVSNATDGYDGRTGELVFRIHDSLVSIAPVRDFALGATSGGKNGNQSNQAGVMSDLSLVCADYDALAQYDRFMIVSKIDLDGYETSDVYALTGAGFEALTGTEFDPAAGFTIEAGTMGQHMRIIQVLKTAVHCYDGDFGLSQIVPMLDEETGAEPRVEYASIADPYILLVRDDASIFIAKMDNNLELEELEKDDSSLTSKRWITGCLYEDKLGVFLRSPSDKGSKYGENIVMFLLSKTGALYTRNDKNDMTVYEPFRSILDSTVELSRSLHFLKLPNSTVAKDVEAVTEDDVEGQRTYPMRRCDNIAGYKTIFLPGDSPHFVLKSSKTLPRVIELQGSGVRDSQGIARVCQIPASNTTYAEIGMSLRKLCLGIDTHAISFHPTSGTFVIGCDTLEPFELPKDDDYHKEWHLEKDLPLKPTAEHGVIKLINPTTWTVIDTIEMEPFETVMCVETLHLEVSESTNERKHLIAVGTAISRGEDLPIKGRVLVYDIVSVIPEPGRPETDKRLKLVAKEDIPRGAVTALSEIGTQGLMLVAQGQKCMVRGLKEDGSLLPVAFMDMNCYVTAVRELRGTGLCLMADAVKGVWFTGYTEEPYKMILFGKSSTKLEVLTIEFLPDGNELFIVACDSDGGIHTLQFDPEHPKSLQGHLLLHRTSFSTGAHLPTCSMLLPRTLPATSDYLSQYQTNGDTSAMQGSSTILFGSPTGVLATLSPLSEPQYRRLSFLSGQLLSSLPHYAGLNPKVYRAPASTGAVGRFPPGVDAGMGRNIIDGALLARWNELGAGRKAEISGRVGFADVDEVREVLREVLGTNGLGYL